MPAARLGAGTLVIALASVLLTACVGTDGEWVAEGSSPTTLKQPVKRTAKAKAAKARPVRSDARSVVQPEVPAVAERSASSSMITASLGTSGTEKIVDLPYRPEVGSRWTGTTETRVTMAKAGRPLKSTVMRDRGEYRIVEKLEKGYRVSYTLHDGSFHGDTPIAALTKPMIQSMKGQSYTYDTDEGGTPTRVLDVDRLKALAIQAMDTMAQSNPELGTLPQLKQLVDGMRAQFDAATPETGVDLFLDPVVRFSMVQGLTNVPLGEMRSYDDVVVSPLTGARMRAKGSFKIAAVDKAKGLATIEWRLTVLPEDLEATRELLTPFLPEGADASKPDEALAQMKMEYLDRATYTVALADGVVRRMDRTAVVKAQGVEKETVETMTLSPAQ